MAIDCSVDSFDGKTKAEEIFKFQRVEGAQYFNMNQFYIKATKTHSLPSLEEFKAAVSAINIDQNTKVVCYDNADGMPACRGAFLLSAMGFKEVRVMNFKFGAHWPKSESTLKTEKRSAAAGEFKMNEKFFASVADVKKIVDGVSSDQLIDCRSEVAFKKGAIPKAKHFAYNKVWSNHAMKESSEVLKAFKDAGIDIEKPMIFTGGLSATVVKAVADHIGFKDVKVFEKTLEEYTAESEAAAKTAPTTTN